MKPLTIGFRTDRFQSLLDVPKAPDENAATEMKSIPKFAALCAGAVLFAGITWTWLLNRQALDRVRTENRLLQQQVAELTANTDRLAAENQQLANFLDAQQTNTLQPPSREMLRLRGEVGRLLQQEREAEQSRRAQMHAAQTNLANAELELERLTKLHSERLVSEAVLSQARFKVELLKAEAKGDLAEAARIRLGQAEAELARATELRSESLISETEYQQAIHKVESIRAGGQ